MDSGKFAKDKLIEELGKQFEIEKPSVSGIKQYNNSTGTMHSIPEEEKRAIEEAEAYQVEMYNKYRGLTDPESIRLARVAKTSLEAIRFEMENYYAKSNK